MTPEEKSKLLIKFIKYCREIESDYEVPPEHRLGWQYDICKSCNECFLIGDNYNDRPIEDIVYNKLGINDPMNKLLDYFCYCTTEYGLESFPFLNPLLKYCDNCITPKWIYDNYKQSKYKCPECTNLLYEIKLFKKSTWYISNVCNEECIKCEKKFNSDYYYICLNDIDKCKYSAYDEGALCEKCLTLNES